MSEKEDVNEEVEERQEYVCPVCGEPVPYFLTKRRSTYAKCPKCGKSFRRKEVPPESLKFIDELRPPAKPAAEEEREEEEEGGISLFERPKPPHKVLEEVLREFGVNEKFIEIAVKRSRRIGGIHPTDLRNMLWAMRSLSGVRDRETAAYIADEYALALQAEQRKAQELGLNISYPIGPSGRRDSYYISDYGLSPSYSRPPTFTSVSTGAGYGYGQPRYSAPQAQPLTREEIAMMIRQALEEKRTREELQELRESQIRLQQETQMQLMKIQQEFQKQILQLAESFKDTMQTTIEKILESQKNVVTTDKLAEILEKREKDAYLRYLEKKSEDDRKMIEMLLKHYEKKFEEFKKLLEEKERHKAAEGYKTDEMRLAAEAMHRVADVIEKKQPLKVIVEALPAVQRQQQTEAKKIEAGEKAEESATVLEKMLPPELVEEGEGK